MKTKALSFFRTLVLMLSSIPLLTGCGSSAPKEQTVILPFDIPLELVELPTGLLMGKYPVTQAQWRAVMGEIPSEIPTFNPDYPVANVSWDDCQRFIEKLNWIFITQKQNMRFRLPTMVERDLACLAGSVDGKMRLGDGTEISNDNEKRIGWFDDSVHPVGQKEPNAFGLYDMLGNVGEWLQDRPVEDEKNRRRCFVDSVGRTDMSYRSESEDDVGLRLCVSRMDIDQKPRAVSSSTVSLPGGVPLKLVELPYGILFGETEITQSQWEAVMGNNPSSNLNPENPVECVSWDDCQDFLKKLNDMPSVINAGIVFRLPVLSEQRYARYAGSNGPYCRLADGTEITEGTIGQIAWYDENSGGVTHPARQKEPNAFHLYDTFGNVYEWAQPFVDSGDFIYFGAGGSGFTDKSELSSILTEARRNTRAIALGLRVCAFRVGRQEAKSRFNQRVKALDKASKSIISDMVPIHGKDYRMGKYEVTQSQWEAVMGENPSCFKDAHNPVETVSWDDCQEFLKKLNALPAVRESGLVFRLPTEEEWEYACRAGATGEYCKLADGTEITEDTLGQVAWFDDNSDKKTHPVGQKQPNAFGLHDMHGNVWEWTQTAKDADRVSRGGGWLYSARDCESSNRNRNSPSNRHYSFGFRLCADKRDVQNNESASAKQRIDSTKEIVAGMVPIPGKNFRMGKYEVTQSQWVAVMGSNPSFFKDADNPVEMVSWDDCQEFLTKLNALPAVKASGLVFRLPTAAEWEYACRAGATGDYCKLADGTEITEDTLRQVAWFADNSDDKTHPVGQKQPNAFGLYDMHGNVWEWTSTAEDEGRVRRGGGWDYSAGDCESSCRNWFSPFIRNNGLGFRLCASGRAD